MANHAYRCYYRFMALKGINVIEFAGLAPGPFCGKVLRDLGARVIRIDRVILFSNPLKKKKSIFSSIKVGGQILDTLAHGKQSIAVNLKQKEGIDLIKNLSARSDVLIEPFRKGETFVVLN